MALQSLLNQTISVYPVNSYDRYGDPVEGAASTYNARFQKVQKSRILANGESIVIEGIVYVHGDPAIELNDKITFGGVNYKVHSKTGQVDGQGANHHIKLEVIKWEI